MKTRINFKIWRAQPSNPIQSHCTTYRMLTMLFLRSKVYHFATSLQPLPERSYSDQGLCRRLKNGQLFQKNWTSTAPSAQASVCSVRSRFFIAILGRLGQWLRFVHSRSQKLSQEQNSGLVTATPCTQNQKNAPWRNCRQQHTDVTHQCWCDNNQTIL